MINIYGADGDFGGWASYSRFNGRETNAGILVTAESEMAPGSYGFLILLHELGHTMGLAHPHDGTHTLDQHLDNLANTIMTYNNDYRAVSRLGPLDIAALSHLYASRAQTDGWNVFGTDDGVVTTTGDGRNDTIMSSRENSMLSGRNGDDWLHGREGNDRLVGGAGDDTLDGGSDFDILTGGTGADEFRLRAATSQQWDQITDFEVGLDQIVVTDGFDNFDQFGLWRNGDVTILRLGFTLTLRLENTTAEQLSADDFLFL